MSAAIELEASSSNPLAAALLEIAELNERLLSTERELERWRHGVPIEGDYVCPNELEAYHLAAKITDQHRAYQRLLHENESLRAQLSTEVRAAKTGGYELEVHCDNAGCGTVPIRIAKLPPEDAIPLWVAGMGWRVDGDRYLCPCCKGGK